MRTALCDQLGIEFPIFAFSHCRDVVAAVSKAGGFGVLGATAFTPDQLDVELDWIEKELGGKPYGVDVLIPAKYVGSDEGGVSVERLMEYIPEEHRRFLDHLMEKYSVPPLPEGENINPFAPEAPAPGATGKPKERQIGMTHAGAMPLVEVSFAHKISLIASALGPPPDDLLEQAHANGVLVAALAGTKQHALRHQAKGVDLIVAQGTEAGGHTGEIGTMVLVPEVVQAVAPLPVLAAGGIATGRQMAASMALGAQGVWCGSVWLTTQEAETQPVVKEKFLRATSSDTVRSRSLTGKPARQLRTAWTDEWESAESPGTLPMPLQPILTAEAQARIRRAANTPGSGAAELANYFVGQVVGTMNQVKPARQVVFDMVEEYIDVMRELTERLEGSAS